MVIEFDKLKDNLFVLRGGGGNTAVFVQANGVTVVDTKNPGWGQPLLNKIKELTNKPVTTIINTHTHGDHVSGNVEFPATIDIVTHENTAASMKEMRPVTSILNPPVNVFAQSGGRGHTNGDSTPRLQQRRQRRGNSRLADESVQRHGKDRGFDHHRPRSGDDAQRSSGVRRLQP